MVAMAVESSSRPGIADFDWCSVDVSPPEIPPAPALPTLLDPELAGVAEPPVVAVDAPGTGEPLQRLDHPKIRTMGVYYHCGVAGTVPSTWLRSGAIERLVGVAAALPENWGLAVWDGWRDPLTQQILYDDAYSEGDLPPGFVSPPSTDPTRPSPHSTGGTVDLTLTYMNQPLRMGTGFDEFSLRAFSPALEGVADDSIAATARDLRRYLFQVMSTAGFVVLAREWWHFEYGTRLWAAVTGEVPRYPAATRPNSD